MEKQFVYVYVEIASREYYYVGHSENDLNVRIYNHKADRYHELYKQGKAKIFYKEYNSKADMKIAERYYTNLWKCQGNKNNIYEGRLTLRMDDHRDWLEYTGPVTFKKTGTCSYSLPEGPRPRSLGQSNAWTMVELLLKILYIRSELRKREQSVDVDLIIKNYFQRFYKQFHTFGYKLEIHPAPNYTGTILIHNKKFKRCKGIVISHSIGAKLCLIDILHVIEYEAASVEMSKQKRIFSKSELEQRKLKYDKLIFDLRDKK